MRKFRRAQAQNQASIEKHLSVAADLDSSSDDDDDEKNRDELRRAVSKVLLCYSGEGGNVEKSLSYLADVFQSGGAICLVCISSVKKIEPIWSCSVCFSFMHLTCVQHWIRDSLKSKRENGRDLLWACPKCRMEYREDEIPDRYLCFCGQTSDPSYQPWTIPHSCGETCNKPLRPACGHSCLLLCHPGPCPPCPKMVRVECFCGKAAAQTRRCNSKEWSCGRICLKMLPNCEHSCREKCHPREKDCPPCSEILSACCRCDDREEKRICGQVNWSCEKRCGRLYPCGLHACQELCHRSGDCGECPFGKNRACPCGKKRYYEATCETRLSPTCGDTCGKLLDCGAHYCNMRCHPDRCGPCLEVVTKSCRCRSHVKDIACAKEFHCNKKCTQMRTCGSHMCNRKCCDCLLRGTFNVCEKLCDNTLNCQKHKCTAPCHVGPCYPCPRTNVVQCRCGNSKITVPCGRTKRAKPPNCERPCDVPPDCHHDKREPHVCHYGPCRVCRKICSLVLKRCGHCCAAICHARVWIKSGPKRPKNGGVTAVKSDPFATEETRMRLKTLPCPPCEMPIMVACFGEHETIPLPCHRALSYSCARPCGRILQCTNHTCQMPCHRVPKAVKPSADLSNDEDEINDAPDMIECPPCERACSRARPVGCPHVCPSFCHEGLCKPCQQLVKVPCHCGINSLYVRCARLTAAPSASREEREALFACGNRCPKNYACGHRCVENCHSGDCPNTENCEKRVKVWCACKRTKKEFSCLKIRRGTGTLECDEVCRRTMKERERAAELEAARKRREEEARNRSEVEKFERKFKPRRARGRERSSSREKQESNASRILKHLGAFGLFGLSIAIAWTLIFTDEPARDRY